MTGPVVTHLTGGAAAGLECVERRTPERPANLPARKARWQRLRNGLDENGKGWIDWFVDSALQPVELAAVFEVLAA